MSYGFASSLSDALPNASFIGLTPSLPPLGRASPHATHCLCRSAPPPSSHRHTHRFALSVPLAPPRLGSTASSPKNDSAVQSIGDDKLKLIAADLITRVKKSVTIDWTLREDARARINVMVRRILNKYGYPPSLRKPPS